MKGRVACFMGVYCFFVTLFTCGVGVVAKYLINRPRPLIIRSVRRLFVPKKQEMMRAMPSVDTMWSVTLSLPYAIQFNYAWFPYFFIPIVGLGRVYAHAHWLGDVAVGLVVGLVFGIAFWGPYFAPFSKPIFDLFFDF